jgi:hypothetical protein
MKIGQWYTGFGFQVSAQPPAKKTAGLIEKETLKKREYRMSNNECRMSKECILSILKRLSEAKPSFEILRFAV